MNYGFCKFPDCTTKFVKILGSDKTHTKVQYPWSDKIPSIVSVCWVHSSWVTVIEDAKNFKNSVDFL